MAETTAYRCVFERIGRNHDVPPLVVENADDLLDHVYVYARPYILSHDMDIAVDLNEMRGQILVGGIRNAGQFTIEKLEAEK